MLSNTKIRAYVRTVSNGIRTMDRVEEEYKVPVYVQLITDCGWTIEDVEEPYKEAVQAELDKITQGGE